MKKIILILILLISSNYCYSRCDYSVKDVNSKYEFTDKVLDLLISVQKNEDEIFKNKDSSVVNILTSEKRSILDDECFIYIISQFKDSDKIKIRESVPKILEYLNNRILYQKEIVDIFNMRYGSDSVRLNDRFSDIKIRRQDNDTKNLLDVTVSLAMSTRFEQSDNPTVDISKFNKDVLFNKLGITTHERTVLLKKISDNFVTNKNSNQNILIGLILPIELLSYKNKETTSLEKVK